MSVSRYGRRPRWSRQHGWTLLLTIAAICALAAGSLLLGTTKGTQIREQNLFARAETPDLECRLVHEYKDKCAFVKKNCPDEQAGLIAYLELFYCDLPKAHTAAFVITVLWLGLLFMTIGIAASEFFCVNLSTIAQVLGMSESLAGVTFLAFGNGSPDVFSTFAAMNSNSGSLAIGELIGAAGFITAVVAGSMAIVRPFKVSRRSFVRDVCFFIVAICFSFAFIADGHIHAWECLAMIALYVFYVFFVVTWHWWLQRRKRIRETEQRARMQFIVSGAEEEDAHLLNDEIDEETFTVGRRMNSGLSDDFGALERAQRSPALSADDEEDEEEEEQERGLNALNKNMRVKRRRNDRSTVAPIRPSLVGALEFRAVLASLQKSSSSIPRPIHLRRYSDDPTMMNSDSGDATTPLDGADDITAHEARHMSQPDILADRAAAGQRIRAVSVNDAAKVQWDIVRNRQIDVPAIGVVPSSPTAPHHMFTPLQPSDLLFDGARDQGGAPRLLHPNSLPSPSGTRPVRADQPLKLITQSSKRSIQTQPAIPEEITPFPPYRDSPGSSPRGTRSPSRVRSPISPLLRMSEAVFDERADLLGPHRRPLKWWPHIVLPSPELMLATLFPTLYGWSEKSWWERILGLITAPSVFLLTITLPVVEIEDEAQPPSGSNQRQVPQLPADSPELVRQDIDFFNSRSIPELVIPSPASPFTTNSLSPLSAAQRVASPSIPESTEAPQEAPLYSPKDWNRWLLAVQTITAPMFIVLYIWANTSDEETTSSPVKPILFALFGGVIALVVLMSTTTAEKPPKLRFLFCFAGFVVSITWISSIANEVVGVLKTLGVVLNISDAILGLTIFAVGNSLGDLVADITVSRLGYPVMALSACFGGPMLNILLGVGISGLWMTLHEQGSWTAPYLVEISHSLTISAASLLFTLVALLIAVPLNKWRLDRRIGWALVGIWAVSTAVNVVLEVVGVVKVR